MIAATVLLLADAVTGMEAGITHRVDLVLGLTGDDQRAAADIDAEIIAVGAEAAGVVRRQPRADEQVAVISSGRSIALSAVQGVQCYRYNDDWRRCLWQRSPGCTA
jgi:hypothetical protein